MRNLFTATLVNFVLMCGIIYYHFWLLTAVVFATAFGLFFIKNLWTVVHIGNSVKLNTVKLQQMALSICCDP